MKKAYESKPTVNLTVGMWYRLQGVGHFFSYRNTEFVREYPIIIALKGCYYDHFWIHRSKWSFWYQMKAPILLITPVNFYVQQMLLVKVIIENVATVR